MTATSPAAPARTDLAEAVAASRLAREDVERELRRSIFLRNHAAEALERSAARPGLDEDERARLRAEYAAADLTVAERRAAVERAREFERAAVVVAGAVETAATAEPVAAALLDLIGAARSGAARGRSALASARRPAPAVRLRGTRPRTA